MSTTRRMICRYCAALDRAASAGMGVSTSPEVIESLRSAANCWMPARAEVLGITSDRATDEAEAHNFAMYCCHDCH